MIVSNGLLEGHEVRVLIDPGATENFLSKSVAMKLGLPLGVEENERVELPNGHAESIELLSRSVQLSIGSYREDLEWKVIPLARYDVILAMPWMKQYNPKVDWRKKLSKQKNGKYMEIRFVLKIRIYHYMS